ncbi:MAG TPA: LytTR family DNA-binding domain-containing protein [Chryseolinea sp.]
MNFKCVIVDDEPLARKLIHSHVSKVEGLEVAGECRDAIEGSNFLRNHRVDLIFLDIQMPEINGLQFVGTLKDPPAVIFTTAFRDFALEAFELDVIDYLLKPISFDRFMKAVNKFFERKANSSSKLIELADVAFIYLKADRKIHKVAIDDITYIESMDEYVKVHLKDRILVTRESISSLQDKLGANSFVRIHRSFIIATKFISSVSSDGVEIHGKLLPFGRAYKLSALAGLGIRPK